MKKYIVMLSIVLTGFSIQSQEVEKNKNAKISFKVDGICGMCKTRIQTAALKTKGVKFAIWDVNTHQLSVIVDERKTAISTIKKNILKAGHDVVEADLNKLKATDEAYQTVHPCCRYRDSEVILDHQGELKKVKKTN
jgi:copper chaperone CopZ